LKTIGVLAACVAAKGQTLDGQHIGPHEVKITSDQSYQDYIKA
jgi:hypothetical protein